MLAAVIVGSAIGNLLLFFTGWGMFHLKRGGPDPWWLYALATGLSPLLIVFFALALAF